MTCNCAHYFQFFSIIWLWPYLWNLDPVGYWLSRPKITSFSTSKISPILNFILDNRWTLKIFYWQSLIAFNLIIRYLKLSMEGHSKFWTHKYGTRDNWTIFSMKVMYQCFRLCGNIHVYGNLACRHKFSNRLHKWWTVLGHTLLWQFSAWHVHNNLHWFNRFVLL